MQLSGQLSEYCLAEVFNFIHEGNRTGLLTLYPPERVSTATGEPDYLWFERGRIVSVTTGLDGVGLLTRIWQRKLMSAAQIEPIGTMLYQLPQPLGIYLKSRGLLDAGQLKLLFNAQTVSPVCKLFEIKNRRFNFDPQKLSINAEMTGLSLSATELGLLGLRSLKDWSGLSAKLPDANYAIQRCDPLQPKFELNRHELYLWELADGKTPLTKLAAKMALSIDIVRQISFRLSTFGTLQEIRPQIIGSSATADLVLATSAPEQKQPPISNFFLQNLRKFLTKK